jgi:sugar/nucleoside kinase (ribokinase family)
VVVLKDGEKGARAYANGKTYQAKALKVHVSDTVGSGDNFDAGFLYGFLNQKSIEDCLKIGCICGGLSARMSGGTTGQPDLKLLKKYL